MKLVSIIIPTYNGVNYLENALQSALSQTYSNTEIIVINDGSTDQTQSIINKYKNKIISYYQPNKGLGASRNQGVILARGDYISFLDCDDLWVKNKLSLQMIEIEKSFLDPAIFGFVEQFHCPTLSDNEKNKLSISNDILPGIHAGTLLLSKKRFLEVGFFKETKQVGEFLDWYFKLLNKNIPITVIDKILMLRRIHRNNMGLQKELYSRQAYLAIIKENLDLKRSKYNE